MTALSGSHGSRAQFFVGTPGTPGTANFEISQYLKETGLPFNREKAEVSAFRSTEKSYVLGLIDAVIPLGGPWDANVDANMEGLFVLASPANTIAWQYGPTGIGGGLGILYQGTAAMTKYEIKSALNGANEWTGELQISSTTPPTRSVQ